MSHANIAIFDRKWVISNDSLPYLLVIVKVWTPDSRARKFKSQEIHPTYEHLLMQLTDTFQNRVRFDLARDPHCFLRRIDLFSWFGPLPSVRFNLWIPGLGEICPSTTISCPDAWTTCMANIESFPPDINAKTLILKFLSSQLEFFSWRNNEPN